MAQLVFNIPDDQLDRVVNAVSDFYGWTPQLGVARGAFVKAKLKEMLVAIVKDAEINAARNTATATVEGGFVDPNIT